ncbi:MAG: PTS-dependent dihydroxyacetone kinase phosphotransferase subunit DhaM [Atopobiaceae bacterium]|nr:PTS-dependent dihydroxyacetone kinase phosphotransferase subunit DhaM [Atopobiaceae bacterium]
MVGIVIVSHSETLAKGVVEFCRIMAKNIPIEAAGGLDDGGIGTSFEKIMGAVERAQQGDGVLILMDLGSAVMTTEMVLETLGDDTVHMVDCPLVEGAMEAAILAEGGMDVLAVKAEAESAREVRKINK